MTGKFLNRVLGFCTLMVFTALWIAADGMDKKDIHEEVAGFSLCIMITLIMLAIDKPEKK